MALDPNTPRLETEEKEGEQQGSRKMGDKFFGRGR